MKKLLLGTITALGLAAAGPAVAQAPSVSLTVGKPGSGPVGTTTTALFGELVRVSGSISSGQPNLPVELTVSPYRGQARVVSLRTDAEGDFRYTHRPSIKTGYSARVGGSPSAQEPFVFIRPKVGLRVISARRGEFRVTMQARPEHVSRVVWFQRRVTRTRWANVKKIQLRNRNLSARFTARLPRGAMRIRILVPQTPGYLRATSAFVRVVR
jgi:hypothetical protein